jgi:hypothetical protein
MRSDETYLESFIDHISSVPAELRRNLALMKDLDTSCSTRFDEMSQLQQDYVERAEGKMDQLEIVNGNSVRVVGSGSKGPVTLPTTEELAAYIHEPEALKRIETVQEDALQRAAEKVAIAEQSHALVDNICKRLESDLSEIEKMLQVRL